MLICATKSHAINFLCQDKQKNIFVSPVCGGCFTLSTHVVLIQVVTTQVVRGQFSFHHRDNFLSISRTGFCPNGGRISVSRLEGFLSLVWKDFCPSGGSFT